VQYYLERREREGVLAKMRYEEIGRLDAVQKYLERRERELLLAKMR
jgi:hypothetical protein